jgi:hypothetical protein
MSHEQIGRDSGVPDTLIGMYRSEPTLRNTRRLCAVLPGLVPWIAAASVAAAPATVAAIRLSR